jgi:hypothetical protein
LFPVGILCVLVRDPEENLPLIATQAAVARMMWNKTQA